MPRHWPFPTNPHRAWSPDPGNSALLAVPLRAEDKTLTRDTYLALLQERLEWMLEEDPEPMEAGRQLAVMLRDNEMWEGDLTFESPWETAINVLGNNPTWQTHLLNRAMLPDQEPFPVESQPKAVEAIKETPVGEWAQKAIPYVGPGLE